MIEVQVTNNNRADVSGIAANLAELGVDRGFVHGEKLSAFRVEFVACADFDDDEFGAVEWLAGGVERGIADALEQQAVMLHGDAAFVVGWDRAAPNAAGNESKHAAAVEAKLACTQQSPVVADIVGC